MTAITEEVTEKQQRVSAETRPVSDVKVPSPRDRTVTTAPVTRVSGIVDLTDGRGYLRTAGYRRSATDLPLTAGQVRAYGLRKGDQIDGILAGNANANASGTGHDTGKTAVLKTIAHAIGTAYPDVHLMLVLVGERPEEVTDLRRSVRGEVISSTFDQSPTDHVRAAELAIERAKRLAELGRDVVVMLDSLTRLRRAYNLAAPASSRTLSGGGAGAGLAPPRPFPGDRPGPPGSPPRRPAARPGRARRRDQPAPRPRRPRPPARPGAAAGEDLAPQLRTPPPDPAAALIPGGPDQRAG